MSELYLTRRQFLGSSIAVAVAGPLLLSTEAVAADTSRVVDAYKGERGTTLTLELDNAPFPAQGSRYRDATVLVFVPHHFRVVANEVDTVIHFHGHNTTAAESMVQHQLREQFYESKQNAILVMPQGPINASSSDGGKLDKEGGLLAFLTDLRKTLQSRAARRALRAAHIATRARIGTVCMSAHSGAYAVVARCLAVGGYDVNEVYLFDALYGDVESYADWIAAKAKTQSPRERHKLISYYAGGKVASNNSKLMRDLDNRKIGYIHEKQEGTSSRAELTLARAVFIRTAVSHGAVTHRFNNLRDCLYASCLKRRLKSDWFNHKDGSRELERLHPE